MSALGQKQTLGKVRPMSALPPKADIRCFIRKMVDHLVLSWPTHDADAPSGMEWRHGVPVLPVLLIFLDSRLS